MVYTLSMQSSLRQMVSLKHSPLVQNSLVMIVLVLSSEIISFMVVALLHNSRMQLRMLMRVKQQSLVIG